ncbi:GDNF family receptor alpha-2 isoform X2 [Silurus meridionalis]|nr:GDNF family receptor alpha-2 isoform X2 [Silurus meridionalis]
MVGNPFQVLLKILPSSTQHTLITNNLSISVSSSLSSSSSSPSPHVVDCVRASEECNLSAQCSSRYRIMRQCLVGKDWNSMLANKECQAALEVLQGMPLMECRCKRGMKKELQCLQNYWSIHMGLSEACRTHTNSPVHKAARASSNTNMILQSV